MSTGMRLDQQDVGGADVLRVFTLNGQRVPRGERLTRDQVLAIPVRNREALVSAQIIREFPRGYQPPSGSESSPPSGGERFVCRRTDLKYDVVEGQKLNAVPLSRMEAEKLAREGEYRAEEAAPVKQQEEAAA